MTTSWRKAIQKVLLESEKPLHYAEISEQVLSRGYYKTDGATPDATVNAQISSSIKHDGEKSPFIRVGKGIFALRQSTVTTEPIAAKVTPIEALEPPQNRKRGDDFSVIEYIQDIDPELRERELQNTLRAIEQKLRGQA